jgi:hypothetical protein
MDATRQLKRRPVGATVASIALGWLAIAGAGNAVVWNLPEVQAVQHQLGMHLGGALLSVIALSYE